MTPKRFPPISFSASSRPAWRWLALAGVFSVLMIPFSARADHRDDGAMEVLASAAVAYAVIGAAGGFDDHRHDRVHYRDHYRDGHRAWSRHDRHDARYCRDARHHHGGWHFDRYKPHKDKYWHKDKYRGNRHRDWDGHHPGRGDGRDYRQRGYH